MMPPNAQHVPRALRVGTMLLFGPLVNFQTDHDSSPAP